MRKKLSFMLVYFIVISVLFSLFTVVSATSDSVIDEKESELSGYCGIYRNENAQWTLDKVTGTLTISGIGYMENYSAVPPPWHDYRDIIKTVIIEDGICSIGNFSFAECDKITDVIIADSVTSIGTSTFFECTALSKITFCGTENQWKDIMKNSEDNRWDFRMSDYTVEFERAEQWKSILPPVIAVTAVVIIIAAAIIIFVKIYKNKNQT